MDEVVRRETSRSAGRQTASVSGYAARTSGYAQRLIAGELDEEWPIPTPQNAMVEHQTGRYSGAITETPNEGGVETVPIPPRLCRARMRSVVSLASQRRTSSLRQIRIFENAHP